MLRHAPVTAIGIISTLTLSGIAGSHFVPTAAAALARNGGGTLAVLAYPFGIFSSFADAVCVCIVLFHTRVLERRFGTGRHLTLSLLCSAIGTLSLVTAVRAGLTPPRSLVTGAAWFPLVTALSIEYWRHIPALGTSTIVGPLSLSEKSFMYLVAARFAYSVCSAAGVPTAAALAALGAGVAVATSRLPRLAAAIAEDGPVVAALLSLPSMGGVRIARHARVQLPEDVDGAIPDDVRRQLEAAGVMPPGGGGGAAAARRGRAPAAVADAGARAAGGEARETEEGGNVNSADVKLIMELGLGCSERDAAEALHVCGGNVDAAVTFLMEHQQH